MQSSPKRIQLVAFDCDSTLSKVEGINEIAQRAGLGDEIARLTMAAMGGEVALEDVYGRRLEMIRPSAADIAWLGRRYCDTVVDDARETIRELRQAGYDVRIVSGGIRQAVDVLADSLDLPRTQIHAVDIYHDASGAFAGYDTESPLARTGGKPEVLAALTNAPDRVVLVGDGVFDLEARQQGVYVIGFGGVITRPPVKAGANAWIDVPSLLPVVEIVERLERTS